MMVAKRRRETFGASATLTQEEAPMKPLTIALLLAVSLPLAAAPRLAAQQQMSNETASSSPVMDAVRQGLARYARNLEAAAEQMPTDKYSYKPTDQQMTFGHLVSHVAQDNEFRCSRVSGMDAPGKVPGEDASKDDLVKAMKASFDFCTKALANVTDAQLGATVPFFGGREATRASVAIGIPADLADHYGQAAMYLRLNGMLPPTARRGGM